MIGRTNTGGGGGVGGAELIIVGGTTRPEKANHNTIWIDTNKEITSHALSATEPENPVEGMAWVTIGDSGNIVATSPIGGEWITVYPLSAKQYISGAWVDKTAKSYQNGAWVDWWNGELYDNGNEYESITGGWEVKSNSGHMGLLTKNASTMKLSSNSAESSGLAGIKKTSPMDLSNYNTLRIVVKTGTAPSSVTHTFGIVNSYGFTDFSSAWTAKKTFTGAGTYDLNISGITSGLPLLHATVSGSFEVEQILLL